MARVVNCPCGHTLTGKDDEELFVLAKQHVKGVDATANATITSEAIINATAKALGEAK